MEKPQSLEVIFTDGNNKHIHVYPGDHTIRQMNRTLWAVRDSEGLLKACYYDSWLICFRGGIINAS